MVVIPPAEDNVVTPVILTSLRNVETPAICKVVAPIPPLAWRVYCGTDVPIPTLELVALAKMRSSLTSSPFLTTKFY